MATIRDLLEEAAKQHPSRVAVRWKSERKWHQWTFADLQALVRASAEVFSGLGAKKGGRIALMSENRPEWMAVYLGAACCGISVVPMDPKLRPAEAAHIIRDSEASIFIGSSNAWKALRSIEQKLPSLQRAAFFDGVVAEDFREGGIRYYDFARLLSEAAKKASSPSSFYDRNRASERDIASIIYTSGTTGLPKGAMIAHEAFCAQMSALELFTVQEGDDFLLVLPLHHAFAFTANFLVPLKTGSSISIVESIRTVAENMREAKSSILIAVPLLAEKLLTGAQKKLRKHKIGRLLLAFGLKRIAGRQIVKALGGRLRIMICGAAPCDPEMLKTWTKYGVRAFEGYGLTECAPIVSLNPENDVCYGSVGIALPGHEIRIDSPNEEGVGEIQISGPSVMKGYWHNNLATQEAFDGAWLRTGDLGKLDDAGNLTITGRKKCLIVNREGKNIYPEEVEQAIHSSCPHILETLVLGYHVPGEAAGEHVGAIIVPDLDRFARENGRPIPQEEAKKAVLDELRNAVKSIAAYKHPRRVRVRFEPFQKTHTLKIKRHLYSLDGETDLD